MSDWKKTLTTSVTAAALGAVLGGVVVKTMLTREKKSIDVVAERKKRNLPEKIIREQLARNTAFWGEKKQKKIEGAFVVVVGVGGVGSHAAHMLVRSGVRKIRVVDFDLVTLSSLNRHAVATHDDVGLPKVTVLRDRFHQFAPFCEIEVVNAEFNAKTADRVLEGNPDIVLDCIDDVSTKAILLARCYERKIRCIASMGAGGLVDPTHLHIADLTDIVRDRLARATMLKLRTEHNIALDRSKRMGILAVYSSEHARVDLLPLTKEQKEKPEEYGTKPNFRLRIMPVLGTLPAIFGMTMATLCLCELSGRKIHPVAIEQLSSKFRNKALSLARQRERDVFKISTDDQKFDKFDVDFLYNNIWRKRCSLTLDPMGGGAKFVLTRWNPTAPASVGNMVLIQPWVADKLLEMFPDRAPDRKFVLYRDKKAEEKMKDAKKDNFRLRVIVDMDSIKRVNISLAGAVSK
jgi:tRNA threonylcarbamoyladenosine dehydratase